MPGTTGRRGNVAVFHVVCCHRSDTWGLSDIEPGPKPRYRFDEYCNMGHTRTGSTVQYSVAVSLHSQPRSLEKNFAATPIQTSGPKQINCRMLNRLNLGSNQFCVVEVVILPHET